MKSRDLIVLLKSKDELQDVYVKIDGGLYYPIRAVKTSAGNTIIVCEDIEASVKSSELKPANFETFAKKIKK